MRPPEPAPPEPPPWERRRQAAQAALDAARDGHARNRLGQFATPPALARALVRLGMRQLSAETPIRFLDPSIGTGALYSALLSEVGERPVEDALGVELDPLALVHQTSSPDPQLAQDALRCGDPPGGPRADDVVVADIVEDPGLERLFAREGAAA